MDQESEKAFQRFSHSRTHVDEWEAWTTAIEYERDRLSQLAESSSALDKHDGIPMLTSFEIRRGCL